MMTNRERVQRAMRRREPDRVPFDLSFGFADYKLAEFRRRTGASDPHDWFGADTRMVRPGPGRAQPDFSRFFGELPAGVRFDEWGVGHRPTAAGDEKLAHLDGFLHPLAALETERQVRDYPLPDIEAEYRYESVAAEIGEFHGRGLAVMGMADCTVFEIAWYMRGMERLLMDFLEDSPFAAALLERITEKRRIQAARYAGLGVDVLCLGDDVGTQRGMLMQVDLWRKWLKGRLASVVAAARRVRPDLLVFYHSDGDVAAIIPDLIEIGIDILNPVQPECMNPAALKKEYGNVLSFWGTIGTQSVFPFGTPADVREEVRLRVETVGRGGGLFLAPTHYIESEVPWENIVAFRDAVLDFGRYD